MSSTYAVRRRGDRFAVMATFLAVIAVALLVTNPAVRHSDCVNDVRQCPNSELVGRLAELNYFSVGFDPWHDDTGVFLGADFSRRFIQDESEESREVPEPLVELVKRGTAALPELFDHLDDDRTTNIGVRTRRSFDERRDGRPDPDRVWLALMIYVGEEYDARQGSRRTVLAPATQRLHEYWVTVGDLCYVAIGQIVNRDFDLIQYGGENCARIMSPRLRPDLLRAVKVEWGHLTANDHRNSLIHDALKSHRDGFDNPRRIGAVKRLCFYYPRVAEDVLHRLLSRRVYHESSAVDFVFDELIENPGSDDATRLLEQYIVDNGETEAIGAVATLFEELTELRERIAELEAKTGFGTSVSVNGVPFDRNHQMYGQRERLSQLLDALLPLIGGPSALENVAFINEQVDLLDVTVGFASKKVDELLPTVVDQAIELRTLRSNELIAACERRMAQQGTRHIPP